MKVVNIFKKKHSFVYINTSKSFRDDKIVVGSSLVFKTTLLNPYNQYRIITEQLAVGTHTFRVMAVDNLNNESSVVEESVLIGEYAFPPRFLQYVYLGVSEITLSWIHPSTGAPDNYKIYSNSGTGSVDSMTLYDTISGTLRTVTYTLAAGNWKFRVEAVDGLIESSNKFIVDIVTPRTANPPPPVSDQSNKLVGVTAENVSVGKIKVTFLWPYGSLASAFRLYHDSGSGVVSYASYNEFNRTDGFIQTYTTSQIYFGADDQEFIFVLRAVSSDGVEEDNTIEYTVDLDGVAPPSADTLTIGTTF